MARVYRSQISVRDYEGIWLYIAKDDPAAADRLISEFERYLALLATMPEMGKDESDLAANIRSFPVGNYLLYYRATGDGIELVRALARRARYQPRLLRDGLNPPLIFRLRLHAKEKTFQVRPTGKTQRPADAAAFGGG